MILFDVIDESKRASGKRYSMRGFASREEAYKYLLLLQGRMVKGDFSIWTRERCSHIAVNVYRIEQVTI